jgi:hypothetical protein
MGDISTGVRLGLRLRLIQDFCSFIFDVKIDLKRIQYKHNFISVLVIFI